MKTHLKSTTPGHLHTAASPVEVLESRVVPAAVFTFTEGDGDKVTVTTSLGTDADLTAAITLSAGNASIAMLDLSDPVFQGTNVSVVATPGGAAGDGFINVGYFSAGGRDLGSVKIDGDVAKFVAGDGTFATPGLRSLSVHSFGKFGLGTGAPDNTSFVAGDVGQVRVVTDILGGSFEVNASGGAGGNLGSLTVGGSLIGIQINNSGQISTDGNLGKVKIGGNIIGGTGDDSGKLNIAGNLGSVTIGGSLVGEGVRSARIVADNLTSLTIGGSLVGGNIGEESGTVQIAGLIGTVKIKGSLLGGDGDQSGRLQAVGDVKSVIIGGDIAGGAGGAAGSLVSTAGTIGKLMVKGSVIGGVGVESGKVSAQGLGTVTLGGSLLGGEAANTGKISASTGGIASVTLGGSVVGGHASVTGAIFTDGDLGLVRIGGDLIGGDLTGIVDVDATGYLRADKIQSIFIGGSIVAGFDGIGGELTKSGSIRATETIGTITVRGSITGNFSESVIISAAGIPGAGVDHTAIAKVTVGGNASYLRILGGYSINENPVDGDAAIGTVKIGGDARGLSVVAGVDAGGDGFGNANDTAFAGVDPAAFSRIASVIIGGQIVYTSALGDEFGIVAQEIGTLKIGGRAATLTAGAGNDIIALGTASDTTLRELV